MKRWISLIAVLFLFSCLQPAQAQSDAEDGLSAEKRLAKLVALGPGVHQIQKDENGHIVSCIVIGQARISTVLGKPKGLEVARNKANLDCSVQFVKWLKEEVTIHETSDEEAVVITEGSETADGDTLLESGKSIDRTGKKMDSVSKGLVRGLQVLHRQVDGEEKTYTIVKGWKADTADGTKKISVDLASDVPGQKDTKSPEANSETKPQRTTLDKEIEDKAVTSEDLDAFFPKTKKSK
jgi:hypothetical protein